MPASVAAEIAREGVRPVLSEAPAVGLEMIHLFVLRRSELAQLLREVFPVIDRAGTIWVSWPKKAAKVATDVTEEVVRAEALPMGLVDVKVCAVDAVWSGLKLVIRRTER